VAIDSAIHATGRIPDAVLSGHVHSYQHFERTLGKKKVAYIVAGAGGYANTPTLLHKIEKTASGKKLPHNFQTSHPDLKLVTFNDTTRATCESPWMGTNGSCCWNISWSHFQAPRRARPSLRGGGLVGTTDGGAHAGAQSTSATRE
jgi:hypothetical protein